MVQSSERINLWWAVMGSRVNAAGTEDESTTKEKIVLAKGVSIHVEILDSKDSYWSDKQISHG